MDSSCQAAGKVEWSWEFLLLALLRPVPESLVAWGMGLAFSADDGIHEKVVKYFS